MSASVVNGWMLALLAIAGAGLLSWLISLKINDVSFVDSLWSLFFLLAASIYFVAAETVQPSGVLLLTLVAIWSIRLSAYIAVRNWGAGEDYRYVALREKYQPFWIKSLLMVFGLQGLLAWVISLPLLIGIMHSGAIGTLEIVATLLWLVGFFFEAGGDLQLARFRKDPANEGRVLDTGLWKFTRHPNYFGDCCVWWSYYLFALAAGGWWTIISPLLMTGLLLKVSGVAMLERDIGDRRPAYAEYIRRTNAFVPGLPKSAGDQRGENP